MTNVTLGEKFSRWAAAEKAMELLVLIGSQARAAQGAIAAADGGSDWDFQLATSTPEIFRDAKWTAQAGLSPLAYVFRGGRLGSAPKVTALFAEGELDLVIIPVGLLREVVRTVGGKAIPADSPVRQPVIDLAAVLQGGYKILVGEQEFGAFYDFVRREVPPARLSDDEACQLAAGFVCDYVSTHRKIDRGEFLAAQRWLHVQLAETNYRFLHELRLRNGLISFPDARRLESLREPRLSAISVEAALDAESLRSAVEKSAAACRDLMGSLVGARWQWPDLDAVLRRK